VTGSFNNPCSTKRIAKLSVALGLFAVAACQSTHNFRSPPRLSLDGSQLSMLENTVISGQVPRSQGNVAVGKSPTDSLQLNNGVASQSKTAAGFSNPEQMILAQKNLNNIRPESAAKENSAPSNSATASRDSSGFSAAITALENPQSYSDSDEAEDDDDSLLVEESTVDADKEALDADSARSPEEMAELLKREGIEGHFALCEGSIYMDEWNKIFESQFMAANKHRYKKASHLRKALETARSEEYTRLLLPALSDTNFDYPVLINEDVIKWIQYFQTRGRNAFVTWLRRAEDITPQITSALEKHGLPQDLIYLAMIESGFNNKALSSAKAAGPWQFMRATGRTFGLKLNDYVDERRDPEKATVAAARYLTYLYSLFGDWHLAAASYNAGEGRVAKGMRGQKDKSFFALSAARRLPNETRNYVPKLIAAMIISKNPSRFGFEVSEGSRAVKTRWLALEKSVRLSDLAHSISVDPVVLETLNPELRLGITPPGSASTPYLVRVPENSYATAYAAVENLPQAPSTYHVAARVRRRESLGQFARRYGITLTVLLKANPGVRPDARLAKGQRLMIPVALGSGQFERLTRDEKGSKRRHRASASHRSRSVKVAVRRGSKARE
jgi:membrane-bound lytic murein transglycosylase D